MSLADVLKPHVRAIESAAKNGDMKAQQIINLYGMHVRCPADPGAPALCEATFKDWLKSQDTES